MESDSDNGVTWKARDAWLCVLALIVGQFVIFFWLRFGARGSHAFSAWLETASGSAFTVVVEGGLWLFSALWFSRVPTVRAFLEPAGLKHDLNMVGWCAACVAIGIALIDGYGVSRGLTASSKQPHPMGYDAVGAAWRFYVLKSVIIDPFFEEAVTRGFLYRAFRGSYGPILSTFLVVGFSAYFHWGSVSRSMFTFGCLASCGGCSVLSESEPAASGTYVAGRAKQEKLCS